MEAIPKLPMISFLAKTSPENLNLSSKLRQLIAEKFGETPSAFANEIKEIETLRSNSCIRVAESIDGVATLKKYYCQLLFIKNRFKINGEGPFQFSWKDLYSGAEFVFPDITYELASVLYNIGSLHTRLGCAESREESEGMKMAVAHFQCAAWAFHTLPDLYPQDVESDLSADLMGFKSHISLAQAQECILEKSILDARKPLIISKVGGQVVEYYKQALRSLDLFNSKDYGEGIQDIVGSKQNKIWKSVLEFKIAYYQSMSYLHMGMFSEENNKMGERVTYYKAASDCLAQSAKLAKKLDDPFKSVFDALAYANDVVNGKLDVSKKENEFIYHDKVPDLDALQEIKGASLVKGIGFDSTDPEVSGPDIFQRLVPIEAHEASSLYSEEQAKLLRTVCSDIEMANGDLAVFLSALQLDDIPREEDLIHVPQELIECAASLSVRRAAVSQLEEGMTSLASVSADVEASLAEIQKLLREEQKQEREFQDIVGPRASSILVELERETQKYHEAHSMASESNLTLNKAMRLHVKNLQLLSKSVPELEEDIPKISDLEESVLDCLRNMRNVLKKVEEMRHQRLMLEETLREGIRNDDITNSLAKQGDKETEKVFKEEMKKHEKTVEYIRQNIHAQRNIVSALTEKNAEYADAREKIGNFVLIRDEKIGSLVASYHAYEDLLDKTTKGLEFYAKLEKNVSKLLSRVDGVVKVQVEEREQLINSSAKKSAEARALSLSLVSGKSQPYPVRNKADSVGQFDYKPEFTPGAPPPDTPEQPIPPKTQRPKLIDYMRARQEKGGGVDAPGSGTAYPPNSTPNNPSFQAHGHIGGVGFPAGSMYPGNYYPSNQQYAKYYAQLGMSSGAGKPTTSTVGGSEGEQPKQEYPQVSQNMNQNVSIENTSSPGPQSSQPGGSYPNPGISAANQPSSSTYSGTTPVPGGRIIYPNGSVGYTSPYQGSNTTTTNSSRSSMTPGQGYPAPTPASTTPTPGAGPVQRSPGLHQYSAPVSTMQQPNPLGSANTGYSVPNSQYYSPQHQLHWGQQMQQGGSQAAQGAQVQQQQVGPQSQIHGVSTAAGPQAQQQYGGPQGTQQHGVPLVSQQHGGPQVSQQYGGPQISQQHGGPQVSHQQGGPLDVQQHGGPQVTQQHGGPQVSHQHSGQQGLQQHGGPQGPQQDGGPQVPQQYCGPRVSQQESGPYFQSSGQPIQQQQGGPQLHWGQQGVPQNQQQLRFPHQQGSPQAYQQRPMVQPFQQQQGGPQPPQQRQQQSGPQIQQQPGGQVQQHPQGQVQQQSGVQVQQHPGGQFQQHPGGQVQQQPGGQIQQQPGGQVQQHPGGQVQQHLGGQIQHHPGGQVQQHPRGQVQQQPGGQIQQQPGGQVQPHLGGQVLQHPGGLFQQNLGGQVQQNPGGKVQQHPRGQIQHHPGGQVQQQLGGQFQQHPGGQVQLYPEGQVQQHPGGPQHQQQRPGVPTGYQQYQSPVRNPVQYQTNNKMQQPGIQQPGIQQPGIQQPGIQQPGIQQPGIQQPGIQQPGIQQPGIHELRFQQPGMPNPGYFPPQFQQQAEKPVMHPVVPQPGTQNRYIPTQPFPQPGNYSSELSKPVNVVTPIPAPTPAKPGSNLDLLSGIDLTPTHRIDSPIIHDQFISSEPSPVPVKLPDTPHNTETVSQRKVRPPMFVIDTDKLKQETEKLQSFVNSLSQKTLQGSVPLDSMWKDANDSVSRCGNKLSVSVGRCYPLKNRAPDVLPFDQSRIELKFSKDDYINASYIKNISPHSPDFIVTQLPLKTTVLEFLGLIWQEGLETVVSLVPVQDMAEGVYIPQGKESLTVGDFVISLQSVKELSGYRERVFHVNKPSSKQTRALLHLELTSWVGPELPASPAPLILAAQHILELHNQQRSVSKPVLIHCRDGGNKSGTVCALVSALAEVESTGCVPDFLPIFSSLLQGRKGILRDKQYLRFVYDTLLYSLQSRLIQQGVLTGVAGRARTHSRHPSKDFISHTSMKEGSPRRGSDILVQPDPENKEKVEPDLVVVEKSVSEIEPNPINHPIPSLPPNPSPTILKLSTDPLSNLADLTQLDLLTITDSPKKKKITKEDFMSSTGNLQSNPDPTDPLSQLNPLWSLK